MRIQVFLFAAIAFFAFYALNITIARALTPRISDESSRWAQFAAFAGRSVSALLVGGGLFLAVIVGLIAQANWLMFLRYLHPASFGVIVDFR
jgi:uncharacterized membrane protein (UPF0182 family)